MQQLQEEAKWIVHLYSWPFLGQATNNSVFVSSLCRPALLYPAIPDVQMDAVMKAGEAIQAHGSKRKDCLEIPEEPLKLKSISELSPQENISQ